jgi:hypothetical protein
MHDFDSNYYLMGDIPPTPFSQKTHQLCVDHCLQWSNKTFRGSINFSALTTLSQKICPLDAHRLQWSSKTFRGSVNFVALTTLSQKAYPLGAHCLQWSSKTFRGSVKFVCPNRPFPESLPIRHSLPSVVKQNI